MGKRILWLVMGILLLSPGGAMAIDAVSQVPEPSTLLLIGSGIAALLGLRKLVK
jgi:hypothetical protein